MEKIIGKNPNNLVNGVGSMMNAIWCALVMCTAVFSCVRGVDMLAVMSQSAIDTVALCVRLAGGYALFNGLISVMAACGVTQMLTRMLRTPLHWLFPGLQGNPAAQDAVSENLVANAVGLGNAATPAGLRAMRLMQEHTQICKDAATDDMCMLLVINATGVQILPTGVLSLRAAAGSAQPGSILLPTLLATAISTMVGVAVCVACRKSR